MSKTIVALLALTMLLVFSFETKAYVADSQKGPDASQASSNDGKVTIVEVAYIAVRNGTSATVFAYGVYPTGGYKGLWKYLTFAIVPPNPGEGVPEVITPFCEQSEEISVGENDTTVTIIGASGFVRCVALLDNPTISSSPREEVEAKAIFQELCEYSYAFGIHSVLGYEVYWRDGKLYQRLPSGPHPEIFTPFCANEHR